MSLLEKEFFFQNLTKLCSLSTPYGQEDRLHKYLIPYFESKGFVVKTGKEIEPDNKACLDALYMTRIVDGQPAEIMFNAHLDVIQNKGKFPFFLQKRPLEWSTALTEDGVSSVKNINYQKNVDAYNRRLRKIKNFIDAGIDHEVVRDGDIMFAIDSVIGGDDRCGIVACMALVDSYPLSCKVLLSTGEEKGVGANKTWVGFYEGVKFNFTLDRPDEADFVKEIHGRVLQSDEFRKFMVDIGQKYKDNKVVVVEGRGADAYAIAEHVPEGFNVSVGYTGNHFKDEKINVQHLYTSYMWMLDAAFAIKEQNIQPFPKPKKEVFVTYKHSSSKHFGGRGSYRSHEDDISGVYTATGGPYLVVNKVLYIGSEAKIKDIEGLDMPGHSCYVLKSMFKCKKNDESFEACILRNMIDGKLYSVKKASLTDRDDDNVKDVGMSNPDMCADMKKKLDDGVNKCLKIKMNGCYENISEKWVNALEPYKIVSGFSNFTSDMLMYILFNEKKNDMLVVNSNYTSMPYESKMSTFGGVGHGTEPWRGWD